MKYLKTLGLAAAAVMALTAFGAGAASATTLENGTSPYSHPTEMDLSLAYSTISKSTGGSVLGTCTGGTIQGTTTSTGSATETVRLIVSAANTTWSGCNRTTDTTAGGELEIHHIPGTSNGTVTGSGFEVTIEAISGVWCIYGLGPGAVDLGTLTGDGHAAIIHTNAVVTEQGTDKFLCPNDTTWSAGYEITTPTGLTVTAG